MKRGVCHPELPIASAGRTQRRVGFIFQIVDLWRAVPLMLREGQQARGHDGSRCAPALIPAAPSTRLLGVPTRAPVARHVIEQQAAFRAGALPDPRRVAIGDLRHTETCDPGRQGRGFRGLRHAQRVGEATANHKPLRGFVETGQCGRRRQLSVRHGRQHGVQRRSEVSEGPQVSFGFVV